MSKFSPRSWRELVARATVAPLPPSWRELIARATKDLRNPRETDHPHQAVYGTVRSQETKKIPIFAVGIGRSSADCQW